jgi:hypothetical protein
VRGKKARMIRRAVFGQGYDWPKEKAAESLQWDTIPFQGKTYRLPRDAARRGRRRCSYRRIKRAIA